MDVRRTVRMKVDVDSDDAVLLSETVDEFHTPTTPMSDAVTVVVERGGGERPLAGA
jgi:hypothetical protein